jgi:nitronate monooxygenase
VVASGGIMDARGVLAVLILGAAGAQLGTRFLLAAEANVYPDYRDRLLSAVETDTVITRAFTGRPARSMRNRFIDEMARRGAKPLPWPHQSAAAEDIYRRVREHGDPEWGPIFAGQGVRLARDVEPAGQIVARIEREARALLERLG